MRLAFPLLDDAPRLLEADEVHLWSVSLDRRCDPSALTPEERSRAERFKLESVRLQFISSRAQLRTILGRYLGIGPALVPISYEPTGKPVLDASCGADLHFNVSHSESIAVFGVTRNRRIGVDVELGHRRIPNAEGIVERFFTERERQRFFSLPESERMSAFFRAWTRKEAVLKAVGQGVQSLDHCEVTFAPGEPEAVLRMGNDCDCGAKWLLRTWHPNANYVAAVAVELSA
jgi:4'-phosphopantetheinyl transferase